MSSGESKVPFLTGCRSCHLALPIQDQTLTAEMSDLRADSKPPIGHYLGTVRDGIWYRRYRNDGFLARGLGRFWCQDGELHFRRFLIRKPIVIPLNAVSRVSLKAWHAGRWAGVPRIIVLEWQKDGLDLQSGFVLTRSRRDIPAVIARIEAEIAAAKCPSV